MIIAQQSETVFVRYSGNLTKRRFVGVELQEVRRQGRSHAHPFPVIRFGSGVSLIRSCRKGYGEASAQRVERKNQSLNATLADPPHLSVLLAKRCSVEFRWAANENMKGWQGDRTCEDERCSRGRTVNKKDCTRIFFRNWT